MRIGRFFGIDLYIHWGWLFIFALVAWALSSPGGPLSTLPVTAAERIELAAVASLLLFVSVVLHEFAHSLVARAYGLKVSRITLYLFGGVSQLEDAAKTPASEALVTAAGPATSLLIALALAPVANALGPSTPAGAIAHYLSYANWALGLFNLLPAIPLDGGRLLHALVWLAIKDSTRATEVAARFSRFIAGLMVAFGVLATVMSGFGGGGLWIVLIGWFIWQSGSAEASSAEMTAALAGKKARDLAAAPPDPIPANATAQAALDQLVRSGRNAAPVMLGDRLLGIVSLSDFYKAAGEPETTPVTAIMTRVEDLKSARPDADAIDAVRLLGVNGFRQIPLIDEHGALVGFITREAVVARIAHAHDQLAAHSQ